MPYVPHPRADLIERGALLDPTYVELMRAGMLEDQKDLLYDHVVRGVREDDRIAFNYIDEGRTYLDVDVDYRRYDSRTDHFEDRYYRLPWDRPSRAITAHIAKDGYWYIHPDKEQARTLSVREAARVQSFPDRFRFAGHRTAMYRMIGNAVPPLLARTVAKLVAEAIERKASATWSPEPLSLRQLSLPVDPQDEEAFINAGPQLAGR
jgi:DNA (cytosine-5)-methyltransferase 1